MKLWWNRVIYYNKEFSNLRPMIYIFVLVSV